MTTSRLEEAVVVGPTLLDMALIAVEAAAEVYRVSLAREEPQMEAAVVRSWQEALEILPLVAKE